MNLQELKDRVYRMAGSVYRDQSYITVLLNDAVTQLAGDAKLQAEAAVTLVPGTAKYDLPADYKSPIGLFEGETFDPCYEYKLIFPMDARCGWNYGIYDDQIVITPTPAEAKTLHFYYYAYPAEMVEDGDEFPLDTRYAQAVVSCVAAMILALPEVGGNQGMIDRYFMIWEDAKKRFRADMQKRHKLTSVRKVEKNW